jgi:hypothetical protein
MNKNNIIRFVQSLVLLPFMTGTPVPMGSILMNTTGETVKTVFMQKQNIKADGILALNQVESQEAVDLKAKADAIDNYFKSREMPLAGMGMKMVEEGIKNNLDWRLLPAIAVRESTGGKFDCIKVTNNPFGWGSCKIGFKSNEEAIETVARNLGGNNPNTSKHYADKTVDQILKAYNPPSVVLHYSKQVQAIMNAIGEEDKVVIENS